MTAPRMTQQQREAAGLRVNLAEARANLLRTNAAHLDLESQIQKAELEIERLRCELDKNGEAAKRTQAEIDQLAARVAAYDTPTLKA